MEFQATMLRIFIVLIIMGTIIATLTVSEQKSGMTACTEHVNQDRLFSG